MGSKNVTFLAMCHFIVAKENSNLAMTLAKSSKILYYKLLINQYNYGKIKTNF